MRLANQATIKSALKTQSFIIYNGQHNLAIDSETLCWHANFSAKQMFSFEVLPHQTTDNLIFGYFKINFENQPKARVMIGDKGLALVSNSSTSCMALSFNENGQVSIHGCKNNQIAYTLCGKVRQKGMELILDKRQDPVYEWYFLKKENENFNKKEIIISTLDKNYALNSRTGERWVKKDMYDIYDNSKHIFKAQANSNGQFCFLQQNGELYITTRGQAVVFGPLEEKTALWVIIKNIFYEQYFLLSQDSFKYLTDQNDQMLQVNGGSFSDGRQSFLISVAENHSNSSSSLQKFQSNENIEDDQVFTKVPHDSLEYKINSKGKSGSSDQGYKNQYPNQGQQLIQPQQPNNYNTSNFAKVGMNLIMQQGSISQSMAGPAPSYTNNKCQKFDANNIMNSYSGNTKNMAQQLPLNKMALQNSQKSQLKFEKVKLVNQGSKRFLQEHQSDIIEVDREIDATLFTIIYYNETEVTIAISERPNFQLFSLQDSPVTPIRVGESTNISKKNGTFQVNKLNNGFVLFKQNFSTLQIIGGKLFSSQLKENDYNLFGLEKQNISESPSPSSSKPQYQHQQNNQYQYQHNNKKF